MKTFLLAAMIIAAFFISACSDEKFSYGRSEKIFGTLVEINAVGKDSKIAVDESFKKIFELVDNIKIDVKNLNDNAGSGEFIKISPEVFTMLKISQKYSALTDGAFDVTIGAAVDLWKNARRNKTLPLETEIDAVKNFVGWQHLILDEKNLSARLDKFGVKINLGGVGKGYGVDIVRKIFERHGITDGIIDFGSSSIFVFGEKKIGLKNPRAEDELFKIITLKNSALSTSGDYEQFFITEGRRYHHIINPKTCKPAENTVASVSVTVSDNLDYCGTVADILSTSIVILGEGRGRILFSEFAADTFTLHCFL